MRASTQLPQGKALATDLGLAAAEVGAGSSIIVASAAAAGGGARSSVMVDSMEELLAGLGSHENVIELTVTDATLAVGPGVVVTELGFARAWLQSHCMVEGGFRAWVS